jgi:hypothetical protein
MFVVSVTVAAGSALTASTTTTRTYTIPGLRVGFDFVYVNKPSAVVAGTGVVAARVSADDTLEISYGNLTAGTPSITAENYMVLVVRHDFPSLAQIPSGIA